MSVCGTGTIFLPSNFSRQREFISFLAIAKCPRSPASRDAYLTTSQPRSKTSLFHPWGLTILLCHCIGKNVRWWYRNINLLVIIYGFRPRLRSRLTMGGRTFPIKPETFDGGDSRSTFATYTGILSCMNSTASFDTASARIHCSSTNCKKQFLSFGIRF